jgi:hypothetical protein
MEFPNGFPFALVESPEFALGDETVGRSVQLLDPFGECPLEVVVEGRVQLVQ